MAEEIAHELLAVMKPAFKCFCFVPAAAAEEGQILDKRFRMLQI